MEYYTLCIYRDGAWSPEFGSYEMTDCLDELEAEVDGETKRKDCRIICTPDDQESIDIIIQCMND